VSDLPKLRFSGSLHIEVEMNLYEHFTKLSTAFHTNYWEMDLIEWGFDQEYERPLAWIMSWLDQDLENADIGRATPGGTSYPREINWNQVCTHTGNPADRRKGCWTEDDFNRLISLVPWMVPAEEESREAPA
jgi:hypothetical protein